MGIVLHLLLLSLLFFIVIGVVLYCGLLWIDAFVKLRRATVSFVMSVYAFAWNNSASTGRIFMKFGI